MSAVTFEWGTLRVRVGEMSRASALSCARDFETLFTLPMSAAAWMEEIGAMLATYSPATVIVASGAAVKAGAVVADEDTTFTLPLTRDGLDALPNSLAAAWTEAATGANAWLGDALKNALSRVETNRSASPSGSGPSSGTIPTAHPIPTTGDPATPSS